MNRRTFHRLFARSSLTMLGLGWIGERVASSAHTSLEKTAEGWTRKAPQASGWKALRRQFPLTKDRVYLNAATHGPAPYPVLEAAAEAALEAARRGELPGRDLARAQLASFLGCAPDDMGFTHNTTEGINIVAGGLRLKRGDEVIMTTQEHVGGALPWLNRARIDGIRLKAFEPAEDPSENLGRIEALYTAATRALALPHITCTTGLCLPIESIASWARERELFFFVDGAQGPGMHALNLERMGMDAYAGCGHKWMLGPLGTGFLYVRPGRIKQIEPLQVGAYSDTDWALSANEQRLGPFVEGARRFDYGTRDDAAFIGLAAAAKFLAGIGMTGISGRIADLAGAFAAGLEDLDSYELLSPGAGPGRSGIITFRHRTRSGASLDSALRKAGFRLRRVTEAGWDALRVSPHIYNSEEDIAALLSVLKDEEKRED